MALILCKRHDYIHDHREKCPKCYPNEPSSANMFDLIRRCMSLLMYLDEEGCALHLDKQGLDRGEVFLAVKAAGILLLDWEKKVEDQDLRQDT